MAVRFDYLSFEFYNFGVLQKGVNMVKNIWAKTILKSYRYLERIADAIDRMVENRGMFSMSMNSNNYYYNNIMSVANKIIELSERKIKLINLKILTERALTKCGREPANLLISKYINGKNNEEIMLKYNFPPRTFFRKIEKAEAKFERALDCMGYNYENLEKYLGGEEWLLSLKNKYEQTNGLKEISVPEVTMERLAVC